jgi:hypothetical protein
MEGPVAKSIPKKVVPVEAKSSKADIDLHDIDMRKPDTQRLNEAISVMAYQLFINRGAEHGNDLRDWLEAEQLVLAQMKLKLPEKV